MLSTIAVLALSAAAATVASAVSPADWIPMRWSNPDPKSLELLRDHPVNCLLVEAKHWTPELAAQARQQQLIILKGDPNSPSYTSAETGVTVTLRPRHLMDTDKPIAATDQGIWPGVRAEEEGKAHAAASGAAWIDTNAGFLRFMRATAKPDTTIWIAIQPKSGSIFPVERYLQAIGDASMAGARWVLAFDDDFTKRLYARDAKALKDWKRIGEVLRFYEVHKEWRTARAYSKLALVQSAEGGGLVSGGVLDMIAVKHTPVKPISPKALDHKTMLDAQLAVAVDPSALTPEQREVLKKFTAAGGTMLTGPPGWKFPDLKPGQITLSKEDLEKLDGIWKEMNSMIGRRNLGARLFNVATMQSNLQMTADAKQVLLQLVNYADFPVENITVHLLGDYKSAKLYMPETAKPLTLELYKIDEGMGVDLDRIATVGVLVLEP